MVAPTESSSAGGVETIALLDALSALGVLELAVSGFHQRNTGATIAARSADPLSGAASRMQRRETASLLADIVAHSAESRRLSGKR